MDANIARKLIALNNRFYAENAASFSATRGAPWQGWRRVIEEARGCGALEAGSDGGCHVLDLACGNLRFERFLADELPEAPFEFHAVDNCDGLAAGGSARERCAIAEDAHRDVAPATLTFHHLDVLEALLTAQADNGRAPAPRALGDIPRCDLTVCFGFLHHVPGRNLRAALLRELIAATRAKGVIAISFWQFMSDARLARKARETDARALAAPPFPGLAADALEPDDHFLGWQEGGSLRYCHHFAEREIDELVAGAAPHVRELCRWSADGASGALNRYVLLRIR